MKQYKLTLTMPDDFQTGECYECPLGVYDHETGDCYCVMLYRPCGCPLHEGQAIEEDVLKFAHLYPMTIGGY